DFWRRWHISLSTWLRDYLYIPLGGSRRGRTRTAINLMLTMSLGGLWHGAGPQFALWGAVHGVALVAEHSVGRMIHMPRDRALTRIFVALGTFQVVCVTWVFFRAPDLSVADRYF